MQAQPYAPSTAQTPAQATGSGIYTYGAAEKGAQKSSLGNAENSGFSSSLGEVPIANYGYMQSIETSTDPGYIKKWQGFLNNQGFYSQKGSSNVTGTWNPTTDSAALQGYFINRFLPTALYSGDPTQASNASQLMTALGVDVPTMQLMMRDPVNQQQLAQGWMMTQPGVGGGSEGALQTYANLYGMNALPTAYQAIVRPDPLRDIRNGLLASPLGLLSDIPLLGGGVHAVVNLLTGNLDLGHLLDDPRNVEAQTMKTQMQAINGMSATDIQNMTPLLQSVADDSGFMGFMDGWDHARNSFLLEIGSTLFTGLSKGQWQNPFDPTSGANIWAQAHADDMASALFGDQWAQGNPVLAGMLNFVVNTADDPLSYIPLPGQPEVRAGGQGDRDRGQGAGRG